MMFLCQKTARCQTTYIAYIQAYTGAVLAQKFSGDRGIAPSAPYPFSESGKIGTPYRPIFFQLAFKPGGTISESAPT